MFVSVPDQCLFSYFKSEIITKVFIERTCDITCLYIWVGAQYRLPCIPAFYKTHHNFFACTLLKACLKSIQATYNLWSFVERYLTINDCKMNSLSTVE